MGTCKYRPWLFEPEYLTQTSRKLLHLSLRDDVSNCIASQAVARFDLFTAYKILGPVPGDLYPLVS